MPDEKIARFADVYGLKPDDTGALAADRDTADYFEDAARGRDAKLAANWVITNLFGALNKRGLGITESPVPAGNLGALLDLMGDGIISGRIAKDVFEEMMETGRDPASIVADKGLRQITDTSEIEAAVDAVIAANLDQAQEVRDGKEKTIGWLMGQVMKATGGKANPKLVNEMLKPETLGPVYS